MTILAGFPASRLMFDQSIESLYSPSDPRLLAYLDSRQLFGGDEFVVVAWNEPNLFDQGGDGLTSESSDRIRHFAQQLSAISGVRAASTQTLADALQFPYHRDRVREMASGALLGLNGTTTAVVLRLLPTEEARVPRGQTIAELRAMAANHDPPAHVVGEPVQIFDMFQYVEHDGQALFRVSLSLLALAMSLLFRRVRWVLLAIVVVFAAITWTQAAMVVSRMQLSLVSSMLNSLVTVIGVATLMHVTIHFRELRHSLDRKEALRQTLRDLGPAIAWTCLTTAAGFAALLVSELSPVRSFAIMMALGTLFVLVAMAVIAPSIILFGRRAGDPGFAPFETQVADGLGRLADKLMRKPLSVMATAAVSIAIAAVGFSRLSVETDFSRNFRRSSPIVESLRYVEHELGGAGNWEINFPAPSQLTEEHLEQVARLARRLRMELGQPAGSIPQPGRLTKVLALSDGLDLVPRRMLLRPLALTERLTILARLQPEAVVTFHNAAAGRMRIVLRSLEQQPAEAKKRLISEVERMAREEFPESRATGLFVLLTFLIESLLSDQARSFVLAAAGIGIMMAAAFRSIRIGMALLLPNIAPIVLVVGIMGWAGLPINIATAMLGSVSMGLTIDCTIHYMFGYRRALATGLSQCDAIRATHRDVGLALVFANFALILGFSVLALSHFIPLIHFGVLTSAAMLSGLVGNLLLLPPLLRWLEPRGTNEAPASKAPPAVAC